MNLRGLIARNGRALSLGAVLICLWMIAFMVVHTAYDLKKLNSATSDNVQWTLSQAEVEFLELQHALFLAMVNPDPDLEKLVEEFDIFYSRMATLAEAKMYAPLRAIPEFGGPLSRILDELDAAIPLIDGPRTDLATGLDRLNAHVADIRQDVRPLSTAGVVIMARQSDAQRAEFATTLGLLAGLTVLLVLALVALLRHARLVSRQTERRGRELSAAYTRLNTILETSLDGVVVTGLDGRIQQFNRAAERIFQHDEQDVAGRFIGDVIVPDHLRAAHDAGMQRMMQTGERRVVGHGLVCLEAMRRSGEVFPVEMAIESAHTGQEEILIAFLRDISHRVAAENEVVEARDRALAGEQAKADFLAMMTHEIRTPLNGILGNLALLEQERLTDTQRRYLHNMAISGNLLMSHVDAVLDVARFEAGVSVAKLDRIHLGQLLQDIVDSQSSGAAGNGNSLDWGWTGEALAWVEVDQSRLQQALLNLVGNAIKFTRQGRVSIEVEQVENGSALKEGAAWVDFRIIDTGVGLSAEDLGRVFEDFQTGNSPLAHSVSGTGLGLGIARRFVTAMGGEIGAESTPGEGSVFWFRLPVQPVESPDADGAPPDQDARAIVRDILLVEDNEINLQLARDLLLRKGHRVVTACNGQEGVAVAATRRFDLILMDIRMPVMDGLEATRAIRDGQGPCRDVPIVAFSANVLPEARDRFIAGGMSDFLGKPLVNSELAQVIERVCGEDRPGLPEQVGDPQAGATADAPDPLDQLKARYLSETGDLFTWLATEPNDWNQIAERAHRIAGSAAAFGQPDLRMALLQVEGAAEAQDAAALAEAIVAARLAWAEAPAPELA